MGKPSIILVFCFSLLLAWPAVAAEPLKTLKGCTLVRTAWADGDSFAIKTARGKQHTVRLYGADCIEWKVNDRANAKRLSAQRRYFGISEAGGSAETSIEMAKGFGESAAKKTALLLSKPFTVHTAYADAMGDGKYKRIYGFITTSEGKDLAGELVRLGLARAFGVYRETPAGKSSKNYRSNLKDLELQAAKRGAGVWAETNWTQLTKQREAERDEKDELGLAMTSNKLPAGTKINPNTAARDQLIKLPGIGEVTANRIIESRPFKDLADLRRIRGIGPKKLEALKPFLEFQ